MPPIPPPPPGNPGNPGWPGNPGNPGNPGDPGIPVTPINPGNPATPVNPVNPIDPGAPVNPSQPQQPQQPTYYPPSVVPATQVSTLPQQPTLGPTSGTQMIVPPPAPKPVAVASAFPNGVPMPKSLPVARMNGIAGAQPKMQVATGKPECGEGGDACKPLQSIAGQCNEQSLNVKTKEQKAELDVLFVVDTSLSMRKPSPTSPKGELAQLASQMDKYIDVFRNDSTDINVAVMLGHGPDSKWHGRLFKSSKGDPAVLKTRDLDKNRMIKLLEDKMRNLPNDSSDAQGEALMLSLFEGINDKNRRKEIMGNNDFFRKDATLAVIFVTDEQDVCFDYASSQDPATGKPYQPVQITKTVLGKLVKGKKGKKVREASTTQTMADPHETRFFANVCSKAFKGGLLKPEHVHDALLSLKGGTEKLMLAGVVYTSNDLAPAVARNDENEMGHGIIELVGRENGLLIDLNNAGSGAERFSDGMKALAQSVQAEMTVNPQFNCTSKTHPLAIDLSTVTVTIKDGSGKALATYSGKQLNSSIKMNGKGGNPYMQTFVADGKGLNKILTQAKANNGTVSIDYKTRVDHDPKTGQEVDPVTGAPVAKKAKK
jgi:archaellin